MYVIGMAPVNYQPNRLLESSSSYVIEQNKFILVFVLIMVFQTNRVSKVMDTTTLLSNKTG